MNIGIYYLFYIKSRNIFKEKKKALMFTLAFLLVQATPLTLYRLGLISPDETLGYGWIFMGYSSMSFLSYFIVSFLVFDIGYFSFEKIRKEEKNLERRDFIKGFVTKSIFAGSLGTAAVGTLKAIETPEIKTVNLKGKKEDQTLSFVQISDLHAGPTIRERMIKGIVSKIKKLNPDLIFFTGDIIDGFPDEKMMRILSPFGELKPPFGKYFVSGNHEFYWGVENWKKALVSLGFQDLDNSNHVVTIKKKKLLITGIQDRTNRYFGGKKVELEELVKSAPQEEFDY